MSKAKGQKHFLSETTGDLQFDYKCLVYPNITYAADLERDSYIVVLKNIIEYLSTTNRKIHWTVLIPEPTDCLTSLNNRYGNVLQVKYELPTYPNTMRTHFDSEKFMKILDWKNNDFDFVYCHLPEHASQIANILHNNSNLNIPIYGYCHWYEIEENTSYNKKMFLANIAGTLEMEECGVNSIWLKNLVLEKSSKYFNSDVIAKLDKIIQPHYLGIDSVNEDFKSGKDIKLEKNTIIFNHRPNEYTGFDWFMKSLDEIRKERKDFRLYTTLVDVKNIEYAERKITNNRENYTKFLQTMYVGVGAFENYSAWSIATTDSLSQGVPYLLPDKLCYPEMMNVSETPYPLFYKDREDFKEKLNYILDHPEKRKEASDWIRENIDSFLWSQRIEKWFNGWEFLENLPTLREKTDSYYKLLKIIKTSNAMSKSTLLDLMGWGVRIGFANYRNTLRSEPDIKFTRDKYIYEK